MQFFGVPTPPTTGHEDVEERQGGEPVLTHAPQRARRVGRERGCRPDHRGIDRDLPLRQQNDPPIVIAGRC